MVNMGILHPGVWQFATVRWKAELDHTMTPRPPFPFAFSVSLGRRLQGDNETFKAAHLAAFFRF
jgi:hypothetical protein